MTHFPSTLTFHFNCPGLLLLLPTSTFRPNVNRSLWENLTFLRAGTTEHAERVAGDCWSFSITTWNRVDNRGFCLHSTMPISFQRGNLRTVNSILPSRFPSGCPVAQEPQNPQEQPHPLPSAPEVTADPGWYAELILGSAPGRVWQQKCESSYVMHRAYVW